ncbi:2-oxoisovalerate dehydrogenase [Jiangella aurantiaca]|uniref:dihydrolipoyllysine-residue succinyltransferase n=1 Tax=Jiangella aurantiaca TaxID=2530373 RepID=A0A4R5AEP2_9ACTN|nr:2-oxoisovalerate dehydrogenase [Jiangella aurantiaca]
MRRIRRFEERAGQLYRDTEVPGFLHLSIGQEATAVGACWPLRASDAITSTHRGHGHCLAKGLPPAPMFAELMGRDAGTCHGRGGSMHIADPSLGVYGANGIVGAGLPIAGGVATAFRLLGGDGVVVAFFGDGAVAQGMFHEAVNLAAVWDLPVIFCCENNHYAEFSRAADQHRAGLAERAAGYGIDYAHVDGNDVVAVADLMTKLVDQRRRGTGPVLVEADTYRWHGHYEGDPERYRDAAEVAEWRRRDPIVRARDRLLAAGVAAEAIEAVDADVEAEIEAALAFARSAPEPSPSSLGEYVVAPRADSPDADAGEVAAVHAAVVAPAAADRYRVMDAVRDALDHELAADPSVFLAGIDVGAGGNVFGLTRGLAAAYPDRVRDTPISETAIAGVAVGAAMAGLRPVVEIMYMDFLGACFDQLLNQAAKLRYMTGGRAAMSLVVRTQFGAGRSSGSQHSQSLEALLAHIPGLTVVMPSTPEDTYGLLRAAIRDPDPVVFVENRHLYGFRGVKPPPGHLVPLGRAVVRRPGTDVTVVSWSRMVHEALAAAAALADEGISAEVVDLRTIVPLDRATVLESLARTNRLLIAHEAVRDFGVGAELAALAVDEGFWHLDAPVVRVAPPPTPVPYAPSLERAWLPGRDAIADTIRRLVRV